MLQPKFAAPLFQAGDGGLGLSRLQHGHLFHGLPYQLAGKGCAPSGVREMFGEKLKVPSCDVFL